LTCNKDTGGCDINQTIPSDYNPVVVETLENASQTPSDCGNKKVEGDEDCDPPNTLCTTSTQDTGICNDKCKCVEPSVLGKEEVVEEEEEEVVEEVAEEEPEEEEEVTENVTAEPEKEEKEPGFFGKIWAWIVSLFS
jgi:hypothetical protein